MQFDAQQGRLNAFKHFQSTGLTSPPDPLLAPATEIRIICSGGAILKSFRGA